jgi:hypothetical protein
MVTRSTRRAADKPANPFEQLLQLKTNLEATRRKLLAIKPDQLGDAEHEAWSEQVFELNKAISAARNATLETLSDQFKQELPRFEASTQQLNKDLRKLKEAVDIINAVSGFLGIISSIAGLLA